jgi:molybdopterin-guanine dinucleotide biosynthesis protein A
VEFVTKAANEKVDPVFSKNGVAGYVFAGGQSQRFGANKAFARLDGKPLWRRNYDALESAGLSGDVTVIARDANDFVASVRTIEDREPNGGPLAGLLTAIVDASSGPDPVQWIVCVACDQLNLTSTQLAVLEARRFELERSFAAHPGSKAAICEAVCFGDDYWQPFPGLYTTHLLQRLQDYWADPSTKNSMTGFLDSLGGRAFRVRSPLGDVQQANFPEDLVQFQARRDSD